MSSTASAIGTLTGGLQTYSGQLGGYDTHDIERVIRDRNMVESGDLIVRKVRNGYRVMVAPTPHARWEEYVAKDIDEVHDVLKLAQANMRLDGAK